MRPWSRRPPGWNWPGGPNCAGRRRTGGGDPRAYREFVAGADLDSEVRLLRVVAAHWPTIRRAAETIERSSGRPSRYQRRADPKRP